MPDPGPTPEKQYKDIGKFKLPNHWKFFESGYNIVRLTDVYLIDEYRYHGKIVGNSKGNTIIGNVEDESIRGKKGDDTLKGAKGEDRLYGGNGEDRLYGGRGYDKLYGRKGDDFLMGGKGDDKLYGGNGDDILMGGKGTEDELYGGNGNDFLSSGPLRGDQEPTLNGGSGVDTFLLGEVDSGNTNTANTGGINWANLGLSLAGDITDLVFTGLPGSKLIKEVVPMVFDVFKEKLSVNSSSNSTSPAKSSKAQIKDFNPVEDVVIIPLQPQGSSNVSIDDATDGKTEISLQYTEDNSTDTFATLEFDFFGNEGSDAIQEFFINSLPDNALTIDSSKSKPDSDSFSLGLEDMEGLETNLETNKFLILGAYSGREVQGSPNHDYLYGTNFGDVIYDHALKSFGVTPKPHVNDADEMHGYGGDDVFLPSAGDDIIYGGKGSDTVSYDIASRSSGINVDLSENENAVTDDGWGDEDEDVSYQDELYNIENIIGTKHDDTITGDDKNNTFTGLGGNNTLDGGYGQDTAIFSGDYDNYTIDTIDTIDSEYEYKIHHLTLESVKTLEIVKGNDDIDDDGKVAFAIDNNGEITVNDSGDLDFKTQDEFTLEVRATDHQGGKDTATVKVDINDVNEPPAFVQDVFNFDVNENSEVGTLVGTVPVDGDKIKNIEQFKFGDGSTYDVESEKYYIGEYGQVSINHEWETIELDQSYSNPVVIASDPTYNGSDPATVRIKNVENDSFELRLQEPKNENGKHPFEEDVSYVVIEEGDWKLADDTRLSVGNYNSGKLTSQGFETVDLTGFNNKPTVLSQVQTYNGGDWVTTRTKNQTASDFKLAMQEEEARNGGGHYEENIGWLAIEQTTVNDADDDIVLQGGTTGAKFDETEDSFSFDDGGFSNEPALIAKLGSYNGWDSANVRLTEITESSFGALVREDTSLDSEVRHGNEEQISYLALNDDSGFLSAVI